LGVVFLGEKEGFDTELLQAGDFLFGLPEGGFALDGVGNGGVAWKYLPQLGPGHGKQLFGTMTDIHELTGAFGT
jgi:hypothetical protein